MGSSNGGVCKRLMARQTFDFSGLAAGLMVTQQLCTHASAEPLTECVIVLRLHNGSNIGTGAVVVVTAQPDGHTLDDPSGGFMGGASSVTLSPGSGASMQLIPLSAALGTAFGQYLQLQIAVTQASPVVTIKMELSLDIVMRGGDPGRIAPHPATFRGVKII